VARIGLVLGAGGVTGGAFHAAVLAALAEVTGWDPRAAELIVGTSAGSVTAAGIRGGLPAADLVARALGEPLSADGAAVVAAARLSPGPSPVPPRPQGRPGRPADLGVLAAALRAPWRARPGAIVAGLLPAGSVSTDAIVQGADSLHPRGWPERSTWICAASLRSGGLVVFGRAGAPTARIGEAVAASCAIPGYFAPVTIGGDRYVDGGVVSLTNVGVVAPQRLDLVLVSAPMSRQGGRGYRPGSAVREAGRAQLAFEVELLRRRGTPVVTFRPNDDDERAMGLDAMDPGRRADVVRQVRSSTLRWLERPEVHDRLAPLGA